MTRFPQTHNTKQLEAALLSWQRSVLEFYYFINHKEVSPASFTNQIHKPSSMSTEHWILVILVVTDSDADSTCLNMEANFPIFFVVVAEFLLSRVL